MSDKNIKETASYKIGYFLGDLLINLVFGIFKLIWAGTVKAIIRNKYIAIVYGGLVIITVLILNNGYIALMSFLITAVVLGIWVMIKEHPMKKRRKYFKMVFEEIGLQGNNADVPYYLYDRDISEFASVYVFKSLIPLGAWISKKDLLETYLNVKIIDIQQDSKDNRITNLIIETQPLADFISWSDDFLDEDNDILNIGYSYNGVVGMNLENNPHAFIAGETGSGKSNILKCLIYQSVIKEYKVVLIDFKRGVSFAGFMDYIPVYYEYNDVIKILKDMVIETNNRLDKFRNAKVDNIKDYNRITGNHLHRKIIFIDELAELLKTRDKEISNILYDSIETLTRLSRATGIHLIMGLQRPDSTIINGQIKNNVSYRVCGRFVDREPSRIMLSNDMASMLPNIKGRFIVKDNDFHEIQSFYFPDNPDTQPQEAKEEAECEEVETTEDGAEMLNEEKTTPESDIDFDFNDVLE